MKKTFPDTTDISIDGSARISRKTIVSYQPPVTGVIPKGRTRCYKSLANTQVKRVFDIFQHNEILASADRSLVANALELKELIIKETRSVTYKKQFGYGKLTTGMLRRKYNEARLWIGQPKPFLIGLRYDDMGYILLEGTNKKIPITFDDCYDLCLKYQIADPRFIPLESLDKIRSRINSEDPKWINWAVPSKKFLRETREKINHHSKTQEVKEIYNSLFFPEGYGKT